MPQVQAVSSSRALACIKIASPRLDARPGQRRRCTGRPGNGTPSFLDSMHTKGRNSSACSSRVRNDDGDGCFLQLKGDQPPTFAADSTRRLFQAKGQHNLGLLGLQTKKEVICSAWCKKGGSGQIIISIIFCIITAHKIAIIIAIILLF